MHRGKGVSVKFEFPNFYAVGLISKTENFQTKWRVCRIMLMTNMGYQKGGNFKIHSIDFDWMSTLCCWLQYCVPVTRGKWKRHFGLIPISPYSLRWHLCSCACLPCTPSWWKSSSWGGHFRSPSRHAGGGWCSLSQTRCVREGGLAQPQSNPTGEGKGSLAWEGGEALSFLAVWGKAWPSSNQLHRPWDFSSREGQQY